MNRRQLCQLLVKSLTTVSNHERMNIVHRYQLNQRNRTRVHPRFRLSTNGGHKRSKVQSSPFRVTFLALTFFVGYQDILTRFPSCRKVALAAGHRTHESTGQI
jgi:hypothetical protein